MKQIVCPICKFTKDVGDPRHHDCAAVLRNTVLALESQLEIRDSQLASMNSIMDVIHTAAGGGNSTPVMAVINMARHREKLQAQVIESYDRGSTTAFLIAMRELKLHRGIPWGAGIAYAKLKKLAGRGFLAASTKTKEN